MRIKWTHIETGQLWLMLECLGLDAVYDAAIKDDYSKVKDAGDRNQIKGWVESHGREPMMDIMADFQGLTR